MGDDGIAQHIPVLGLEGLEDPEMLEGDSLHEPKIDALHAFETFMGRTYDSAEREASFANPRCLNWQTSRDRHCLKHARALSTLQA